MFIIDCEFLGFTINAKFNGCTYEDYDKCLNDAGYNRDTYKLPSSIVGVSVGKVQDAYLACKSGCEFKSH